MEENFTLESFQAAIAKGVTLIDFWATWCGPCKMMMPILEQVKTALGSDVQVLKVNIEDHQDIAQQFSVRTIPAFYIVKDGDVMEEYTGVQDKNKLIDAVRSYL